MRGRRWALFSTLLAAFLIWASNDNLNITIGSAPDPCAGFDFCDKFSDGSIDTGKWTVANVKSDEIACYKPAQVVEAGGNVTETIKKETTTCNAQGGGTTSTDYSGGAMQSVYAFQYGTIDVRMKFAGGQGPWPALWMLGYLCQDPIWLTSSGCSAWPGAGAEEVDIAEFYAASAKTDAKENLISSVDGNTSLTATVSGGADAAFHIYTLVWSASSLVFKLDGTTVNTINKAPNTKMFLIINATIGGSNGTPITDANLPQSNVIDYVHIDAA